MEVMQTFLGIYEALIEYRSVYVYQLVPILYFISIFSRLMYYKCKYGRKIFLRDILTLITLIILVLDYVNYLYFFVAKTGRVLSFTEFLIKYSLGTILWIWMFVYHYEVCVRKDLLSAYPFRKRNAIFAYAICMILILFLIGVLHKG